MFEDDNRTTRRGITISQRYNKTIVACCDWGPWRFVHPRGEMALLASPRVPFSPLGVQNTMDPVTAYNNVRNNIKCETGELHIICQKAEVGLITLE